MKKGNVLKDSIRGVPSKGEGKEMGGKKMRAEETGGEVRGSLGPRPSTLARCEEVENLRGSRRGP